ncbi:hypothetical protein FACS1894218_2620 [Bacilli bacterium]|nr:hypothetical protein FACS1894218_2620 [Bacilli bacterium]
MFDRYNHPIATHAKTVEEDEIQLTVNQAIFPDGNGSIIFSKEGYECTNGAITVFDLRHDFTTHFDIFATSENTDVDGATKSVYLKMSGLTDSELDRLKATTTFKLFTNSNTEISTSSRVFGGGIFLDINAKTPHAFNQDEGHVKLENIPFDFFSEDGENIPVLGELIPHNDAHYTASATTVGTLATNLVKINIASAFGGIPVTAADLLSANIVMRDSAGDVIDGIAKTASGQVINLNLSTSEFAAGVATITITKDGYICDNTNPINVTLAVDTTTHYDVTNVTPEGDLITKLVKIKVARKIGGDPVTATDLVGAVMMKDRTGTAIEGITQVVNGSDGQVINLDLSKSKFAAGAGTITINQEGYTCDTNPINVTLVDTTRHYRVSATAEGTLITNLVKITITPAVGTVPVTAIDLLGADIIMKDHTGATINGITKDVDNINNQVINLDLSKSKFDAGEATITIDKEIYTCDTDPITVMLVDTTTHYTANAAAVIGPAVTNLVKITVTGLIGGDPVYAEDLVDADIVMIDSEGRTIEGITQAVDGSDDQVINLDLSKSKFAAGVGTITITQEGYTCDANPINVTLTDVTTHYDVTDIKAEGTPITNLVKITIAGLIGGDPVTPADLLDARIEMIDHADNFIAGINVTVDRYDDEVLDLDLSASEFAAGKATITIYKYGYTCDNTSPLTVMLVDTTTHYTVDNVTAEGTPVTDLVKIAIRSRDTEAPVTAEDLVGAVVMRDSAGKLINGITQAVDGSDDQVINLDLSKSKFDAGVATITINKENYTCDNTNPITVTLVDTTAHYTVDNVIAEGTPVTNLVKITVAGRIGGAPVFAANLVDAVVMKDRTGATIEGITQVVDGDDYQVIDLDLSASRFKAGEATITINKENYTCDNTVPITVTLVDTNIHYDVTEITAEGDSITNLVKIAVVGAIGGRPVTAANLVSATIVMIDSEDHTVEGITKAVDDDDPMVLDLDLSASEFSAGQATITITKNGYDCDNIVPLTVMLVDTTTHYTTGGVTTEGDTTTLVKITVAGRIGGTPVTAEDLVDADIVMIDSASETIEGITTTVDDGDPMVLDLDLSASEFAAGVATITITKDGYTCDDTSPLTVTLLVDPTIHYTVDSVIAEGDTTTLVKITVAGRIGGRPVTAADLVDADIVMIDSGGHTIEGITTTVDDGDPQVLDLDLSTSEFDPGEATITITQEDYACDNPAPITVTLLVDPTTH